MAELKRTQIRERLRGLSDDELSLEISAQYAALFDLRRRNSMRQLENTSAIRDARKQIARAKTLLRERELAAQREAK